MRGHTIIFNYQVHDKEIAKKLVQFAIDNNLILNNYSSKTLTDPICNRIFLGMEVKIDCIGRITKPDKSSLVKENLKQLRGLRSAFNKTKKRTITVTKG
jgi:hypothetical protein